ncbi:MAG: two-component sensor histidine kinase, partial [Kitasatospora sp.]|nr:two-component sensor histidine kinase [Kitasatospora sp.]
MDIATAVLFVLIDTVATLGGTSWWPAHPGTLAWVLRVLQAAACFSLAVRHRAPYIVIGILSAFTLAVTLLISPAGVLTPAHDGNIWAPFATTLVAYAPLGCSRTRRDQRAVIIAIILLTVVVARPWQPSVAIIAIAILRV